jgi:Encapsulating protein for peroxidase
MTAVTLAINAANRLSRAEDLLIFQGDAGIANPLFQSQAVNIRNAKKADYKVAPPFPIAGLLPAEPDQQIPVEPTEPSSDPLQNRYGENTFGAVAKGYSRLHNTHYGRQALVLPTSIYADTYAPLRTTLIMPADRIKGLVEDRFYGTSSLPDQFDADEGRSTPEGVLVALDGNTMDLVIGMDAITAFMQIDGEGLYRFRVFERFTLRLKDRKAVVELDFQPAVRQSVDTKKK